MPPSSNGTPPPAVRRPGFARRFTFRSAYGLCCFLAIAVLIFPLRYGSLRALLLASLLAVWLGGVYLLWKKRRRAAIALLVVVAVPLLAVLALPGRPTETDTLRTQYLEGLRRYEGTFYIWGGETRTGIDCSGLCRAGLIDTLTLTGLRTANPAPLRDAATLWWRDCSAQKLGEEYRGQTQRIGEADSLNEADYALLRPGDMAVVAGGSHILAYLGDHTWIEADPNASRVRTVAIPSQEGYFSMHATLIRWSALAAPGGAAAR